MQRYFSSKLDNNKFILNDDDIYHILRVMRMKENDLIEVVYNHELYICKLKLNENVEVIIDKKIDNTINEEISKILIVPLLKENKMDLILQKATELGINKIIPVIMERSIIKLDESKEEKRIERWTRICKEASEQSKRVDIPEVTKIKRIEELKDLEGNKIICSTSENSLNLKNFLNNNKKYDKIYMVVGPEGGISPKEEQKLVDLGFTRVSLGKRIMRVETVPLFLLSALNYEYME
ncbi:MAG TPA: RsmE family RNA methyltransferase [Bacilli bacterium]|nr:RsmE family RNA methyltransferase [Bacilli bacterium]